MIWQVFRAEFDDFLLATGPSEKSKIIQAASLRRLMGSECRHVCIHSLTLTEDQQKDPSAILGALEDYFKPAKNVIYERYMFGCCKQETDEPIDSFLTRIKERALSCEYHALRDELVRDRLVLAVASEGTRRRLLRERELTLQTATDICRLSELTERQMRVMTPLAQTDSVNATDRRSERRAFQRKMVPAEREPQWSCKYCGGSHKQGREQCLAETCRICGISNHFAKVCQAGSRSDKIKKVNVLEDDEQREEDSDPDCYRLFQVTKGVNTAEAQQGRKWFVNLCLNKKRQQWQLDTGSTCNVMGHKIKEKLSPRAALRPSIARLKLYSGEIMP